MPRTLELALPWSISQRERFSMGSRRKVFVALVLSNECNLCCFVWSWFFFFNLLELKFCVMWSWCWLNVGGNDLSLFPYAVYDGYKLSKWSYRVNMPWIRYTGVRYLSIWLMTSKLATVWSSSTNDLLQCFWTRWIVQCYRNSDCFTTITSLLTSLDHIISCFILAR